MSSSYYIIQILEKPTKINNLTKLIENIFENNHIQFSEEYLLFEDDNGIFSEYEDENGYFRRNNNVLTQISSSKFGGSFTFFYQNINIDIYLNCSEYGNIEQFYYAMSINSYLKIRNNPLFIELFKIFHQQLNAKITCGVKLDSSSEWITEAQNFRNNFINEKFDINNF